MFTLELGGVGWFVTSFCLLVEGATLVVGTLGAVDAEGAADAVAVAGMVVVLLELLFC